MRGDWNCATCQRLNFRRRTKCYRCGESHAGLSRVRNNAPTPRVCEFRPGDWFCAAVGCQAHNFADRCVCIKCGALKSIPFFFGVGHYTPVFPPVIFGFPDQGFARISRRGWRIGDWFCGRRDCNAHNYGDRVQCFKCDSPRELVGNISN
ncbi:putative Zinc finger, RanBP2-type [Helianthus annuus]|uniref:Zinc finger, RanBP2-type n=1 Tax=Helianthus annuus TaxID=4232 RepID=A0A9K3HUN1_HELAN|nr:putative Zinc finger, RanBP2-type [Helianthus annuus]KAJ0512211.1 putative Zinc finger, RanBP2-type [Helianthus annuus]KAJ0519648.1 putative Zinc finger, RanBP2-type [Helianthus annuus]KAJ0687641.1 putative Zinc finger, RanBP2-type [Helianthus annuus]KAJ0691436.1 putative Zinc finger, RanBP2-type [Helianthus annuus]